MGTVNGYGPVLFFVDTGSNADYGSRAFFPSPLTVRRAGIPVDRSKGFAFHGSGSTFTAYPIRLKEVALGSVVRYDLAGAANVIQSPVVPTGQGRRMRPSGGTQVSTRGPGAGPTVAVQPTIGGSVSSGFLRPFSLPIDTTGMRLFVARSDVTE
jgi:hypothetical protein